MYQTRIRGVVLAMICAMSACGERKGKSDDRHWSPPTVDDQINTSFAMAVGTWGWARGDSTCLGNTHTISFSPDRQVMTLKHNAPRDTTAEARETTYSILSAGPGRFLNFPHVIRGAMVGETRRTTTEDLVVWDLVLVTSNRYHWHRTDWSDSTMTAAIVRCDGTRPLERWTPQPPPPVGPVRK